MEESLAFDTTKYVIQDALSRAARGNENRRPHAW